MAAFSSPAAETPSEGTRAMRPLGGLGVLLRVQLLGLVNSFAPVRSNMTSSQRKRRIALVCVGTALLGGVMLVYASLLSVGLASAGLAGVLPGIAVLLASLMGVMFTFIKAHGVLFGFKDYDLIMSLPVSRRVVVLSRMAALLCAAELLALVTIPLYVVYFLAMGLTPGALAAAAVATLLAPLAPTAITAFIAFGITALTARFRHAGLAYTVIALAAITAVAGGAGVMSFYASSTSHAEVNQAITVLAPAVTQALESAYPPAAWAAAGITGGQWLLFALYVVFSLGVAGACLEVMQRFYLRINGALAASAGRSGDGARALAKRGERTRSPFWALVGKEWSALIGIPLYAFNCLFGYVFLIGAAVLLTMFGADALLESAQVNGEALDAALVQQLSGVIAVSVPWMFAFCSSLCYSAAPSVSIEGRNAWIMMSLPLPARTILGAKFAANALPFAASLFIAIVIMLAGGLIDALGALEVALIGNGSFLTWVGLGMRLDVRRPNFTWVSPQQVVKSGMPVTVCAIGGIFYSFIAGALVTVGALSFGIDAMHGTNLLVGAITVVIGAISLARTLTHAELTQG